MLTLKIKGFEKVRKGFLGRIREGNDIVVRYGQVRYGQLRYGQLRYGQLRYGQLRYCQLR